jgi:hypothetical protein
MSDDDHAERNKRLKSAMRQKETTLNTSGKEGVVVCSPSQTNGTKMPTGHVEVGTGKKS